ncbi:MAG: hypothetical protein OMM_01537 [Candidatus Magnetoglobus multicellularis str. Araruama]|uniref:PKD domain-containing protein n=1 Tax=Candidatus Magnetoglobus multicellularis str. Araruama TaxID=890399 RepID=A0A1V1PCY9_9BACT|nr:MAG: hypothetical protein OMM_01537 [Candidatus Magnetoglobus multicellularis str. Araruama]
MQKRIMYLLNLLLLLTTISFAASPEFVWVNQTVGVHPRDVVVDPYGNSVIVGSFNKNATIGDQKLFAEKYGWFIAKYSENNDRFLWCKQIHIKNTNPIYEYPQKGLGSVLSDINGNIIVSGNFETFNYNNISYQAKGYSDIIIIKFDPDGNYLWHKILSGPYDEYTEDINSTKSFCTDNKGNIIISGKFITYLEIDNTVLNGWAQPAGEAKNYDIFTAKFSQDGKLVWVRKDGGVFPDWVFGTTTDHENNVIITGSFCGPSLFGDTNFYTPEYDYKFVLSKYSEDGEPMWAKQWDGPGLSGGKAVTVDSQNNIIVGGYAFDGAVIGNTSIWPESTWDPVFAKYSSKGDLLWFKQVETDADAGIHRIITDLSDNIYAYGYYDRNIRIDDYELIGTWFDNFWYNDTFLAKLTAEGDVLWLKKLSNVGNIKPAWLAEINGIAIDSSQNLRVTGRFKNTSHFDNISLTSYTEADMFLGRMGEYEYTKPSPDFFASTTEGEIPLQVKFYDQSYGVVSSWEWDFDNNDTVDCSTKSCTHTYTESGVYSVKLTITNDKGTSEKTIPYYIVAGQVYPSKADFKADITYGPLPLTVTFTELSSYAAAEFEWDFNDDGTPDCSDKQCTYTYLKEGKYTVCLLVKNERGQDKEIKQEYISAGPPDLFISSPQIQTILKERETSHTSVSLMNTGNSTLDFTVELIGTVAPILDGSFLKVFNAKRRSRKTPIKPLLKGPYADSQIVVRFRKNAKAKEKIELMKEMGAEDIKTIDDDIEIWIVQPGTVKEKVLRYYNHPACLFIEPNYIRSINEIPNDPGFSNMWGLHSTGKKLTAYYNYPTLPDGDIDIPEAWDYTNQIDASEVVIAVIDTGIDYEHEDLQDILWDNPGETGLDESGNDKANNNIDDDNNGYIDDVHGWNWSFSGEKKNPFDDQGHGTRVSGIIGANRNNQKGISGICPNVKIMPLKVFDQNGGMDLYIYEALKYVTMMRSEYGINVRIVNMSYGGYDFAELEYLALERLKEAGILLVASAGNEANNTDIHPHYPSCYDLDNILSVAGADNNNELFIASNYGKESIDLGAPATYIYTTIKGNRYFFYSGTSYAAPHVAGVAALLWQVHPDWTYQQVKQRILESVDPLYDFKDRAVSQGKINANNAVRGQASWLSSKIHRASIQPGESIELELSIHADYIEQGDYSGMVVLHTNIEKNSKISIPVSISVLKNDETAELSDLMKVLRILAGIDQQVVQARTVRIETAITLMKEIGGF